MLFKYAQTCIKTNGFASKYFNIARSCRQGFPIAPLVYILHAEPVACAIRGDSEIQGIKLPGRKDGEYIETKLCMFTCICQVSTFPNMDTIFHFIYYWFPYLIILYIITMMNAKSFNIILCPGVENGGMGMIHIQ
jgi:hypothetical protein